MPDTGLFAPMKHKYLSKMISLKTRKEAAESVKALRLEFSEAATQPKRIRIARATVLAANRAQVMARNATTPEKRNEKRIIYLLYRAAAKKMFAAYTE
jgi:hypothetical protein